MGEGGGGIDGDRGFCGGGLEGEMGRGFRGCGTDEEKVGGVGAGEGVV